MSGSDAISSATLWLVSRNYVSALFSIPRFTALTHIVTDHYLNIRRIAKVSLESVIDKLSNVIMYLIGLAFALVLTAISLGISLAEQPNWYLAGILLVFSVFLTFPRLRTALEDALFGSSGDFVPDKDEVIFSFLNTGRGGLTLTNKRVRFSRKSLFGKKTINIPLSEIRQENLSPPLQCG